MERVAVAAAEQLADGQAVAIPGPLIDAELAALGAELAASGAQLADEQRQAVRVACSERRLVVVVGQAGTGKSTALTGVARAHQAAGRELIVTSTGAQAAERLTAELLEAGVTARGYSTRALEAAVARGAVTLSPNVTVIHDEAALASTREQAWLLRAAAGSGARVIEVGDPRQSQAVGAGGLWPQIDQAARQAGGLVELSRIVRAKDAADRRDQARWRAGEHERALAGYAARGRVIVEASQRQAQDRALEAAHADRQAGKRALVVVQTSNEQLDELNARAQALRAQDGLVVAGEPTVPLQGRPYGLRAGDEIVLRAGSRHPQLGAVRNGTLGRVVDVADDEQSAAVRLGDGRETVWERAQLDAASARLAYVSHTFPAQGQTVDRAHVIAGEHADSNGTYVTLTRARERTHLYASVEHLEPADAGAGGRGQQLASLAEQLGRSEPEVPSIAVALAHEQHAEREHSDQSESVSPGSDQREQLDQACVERDQALAELEQVRVWLEHARLQRDQTVAVMDGEPRDQRVALAYADAQRAGERARHAAARGEQLERERAEIGRLARLGERGRSLRAQLGVQRGWERDALAEQHRYSAEADAREVKLHEPRREWEARHPGARERHHAAEREHQLAEQSHQAAQQAYEIANTRAVHAVSYPARLVPGRAEPGQLTPGLSHATRPGPRLPGHERSGPTIER